ncbi:MAG TPA: hypothetical protein VMS77_03665 [Conexivisphaerales archaeon]|nr:hypothetical protein [Conexivisphaerales archaeon]
MPTMDANLYTQIGLDSGSLTMLGTVVHSIPEPGEYRGVLHRGDSVEAVFYVKVDKESASAQANIDLSALGESSSDECKCHSGHHSGAHHFVVNPRGYVVLHVSKGSGGYFVVIEKAEENSRAKPFDSRSLQEGDLFAATILRPGTYSFTNLSTKAQGEVVVPYPVVGKFANPPPAPLRITSTRVSHEPKRIVVQAGQGMIFEPKVPSRFKIELVKADDGPSRPKAPARDGWRKPPSAVRAPSKGAKTK